MNIEIINYESLTEEEKKDAPNNGAGEELANYMRVTWPDRTTECHSDAMEPEDALFLRDLSWIPDLVTRAYETGLREGASRAMGGAGKTNVPSLPVFDD